MSFKNLISSVNITELDENLIKSKFGIFTDNIKDDFKKILLTSLVEVKNLKNTLLDNNKEFIDLKTQLLENMQYKGESEKEKTKQKKLLEEEIDIDNLFELFNKYLQLDTINNLLYIILILSMKLHPIQIKTVNKTYLCGITTEYNLYENSFIYVFEEHFEEYKKQKFDFIDRDLFIEYGFADIIYVAPFSSKTYIPIIDNVGYLIRVDSKNVMDGILKNLKENFKFILEDNINLTYGVTIVTPVTTTNYDPIKEEVDLIEEDEEI